MIACAYDDQAHVLRINSRPDEDAFIMLRLRKTRVVASLRQLHVRRITSSLQTPPALHPARSEQRPGVAGNCRNDMTLQFMLNANCDGQDVKI